MSKQRQQSKKPTTEFFYCSRPDYTAIRIQTQGLNAENVVSIIQKSFNIPKKYQLIMINGNQADQKFIKLSQVKNVNRKQLIYAIDTRKIPDQTAQLTFYIVSKTLFKSSQKFMQKFTVPNNMQISHFFYEKLNIKGYSINDFIMIYCGKAVQNHSIFAANYIENDSTLFLQKYDLLVLQKIMNDKSQNIVKQSGQTLSTKSQLYDAKISKQDYRFSLNVFDQRKIKDICFYQPSLNQTQSIQADLFKSIQIGSSNEAASQLHQDIINKEILNVKNPQVMNSSHSVKHTRCIDDKIKLSLQKVESILNLDEQSVVVNSFSAQSLSLSENHRKSESLSKSQAKIVIQLYENNLQTKIE